MVYADFVIYELNRCLFKTASEIFPLFRHRLPAVPLRFLEFQTMDKETKKFAERKAAVVFYLLRLSFLLKTKENRSMVDKG